MQKVQRDGGSCVEKFLDFFSKTDVLFASLQPSLPGSFDTLDERVHCFRNLISFSVHLVKFLLGDVAKVKGNVKLGLNFRDRAFGDKEELNEFNITTSTEPLGYVRHDGDRCPLDLVFEAIILAKPILLRQRINSPR